MLYLWIKAFHIIAVVSWFAGLFYLPRLFVYHADAYDNISQKRFSLMESKLYWAITTPAGIAATLLGLWMVWINPILLTLTWFHAKLGLVTILWIYHLLLNHYRKQFAQGNNQHSHIFFRWLNEVPTIILIATVILVVVRPF